MRSRILRSYSIEINFLRPHTEKSVEKKWDRFTEVSFLTRAPELAHVIFTFGGKKKKKKKMVLAGRV